MNAVDHCVLLGDALGGCSEASDKLEGLAFAGDRLAQRGIINAFRWLWERGRMGALEFTSRCIPFARVAAEHDKAALNELAGLLHVRGMALRELKDTELEVQADDLQAEALSILNWLADHGDEAAGAAVPQFVAAVPPKVAELAHHISELSLFGVESMLFVGGVAPELRLRHGSLHSRKGVVPGCHGRAIGSAAESPTSERLLLKAHVGRLRRVGVVQVAALLNLLRRVHRLIRQIRRDLRRAVGILSGHRFTRRWIASRVA